MALLPSADRAILDLQKLEGYCLDPEHPRGRHKARVFRETLALTRRDARWLQSALLDAVRVTEAVHLRQDRFGTHWRVDVSLTRQGRRAVIRTLWIIRTAEQAPRFVTCWVMR
jgi:hypothetical protein